jgi:hypothetical protein
VRDDTTVTTDADGPTQTSETTDGRIVLGGPDDEDPDDADPADAVDTAFLDLVPGDCVGEVDTEGEVLTLPVVDCSVPHLLEVFYSGALRFPGGAFPGEVEVDRRAERRCGEEFADYVGIPYDESELGFVYFSPTLRTTQAGDTSVQCLLEAPEPVSRSLRDSLR